MKDGSLRLAKTLERHNVHTKTTSRPQTGSARSRQKEEKGRKKGFPSGQEKRSISKRYGNITCPKNGAWRKEGKARVSSRGISGAQGLSTAAGGIRWTVTSVRTKSDPTKTAGGDKRRQKGGVENKLMTNPARGRTKMIVARRAVRNQGRWGRKTELQIGKGIHARMLKEKKRAIGGADGDN